MILVFAGTRDGRELARKLVGEGYEVMASVVSAYGKQLVSAPNITVNEHPLDLAELNAVIEANRISAIVDASHPYAENASKTAMAAARAAGIFYLRFEREEVKAPPDDQIFYVPDYCEAAKKAAALGKRIFLTTGSRNLRVFVDEPALKDCTLIARVLPEADVVAQCARLGFTPKTLIALEGPFSHELNLELYKKYAADVVVTKNSGAVGGTDTKLTAADALGLPVVVIARPKLNYPRVAENSEDVLAALKENRCE